MWSTKQINHENKKSNNHGLIKYQNYSKNFDSRRYFLGLKFWLSTGFLLQIFIIQK